MNSSLTILIFLLLTLLSTEHRFSVRGTVTQSPSGACVGESITVSCVLTLLNAGDEFDSRRTNFILGETNDTLTETLVDGTGTVNGIDLSRFMADDPLGSNTNVTGSITLLSYQTSDENLRMGCGNDFTPSGGGSSVPFILTRRLNQAQAPSTPSISQSQCFGVKLSWLAPATDRALTQHYLYRDSSLISTLSNTTTQYTDTDPLILNAAYLYSLTAASCAGNSSSAAIPISVPDNNFGIRLNVSENSLIKPGLTSIATSVPLLFNFTLYNNTDVIETLSNIAYSDLNSQSFQQTKFVCDVCYRMTASVLTCSDQVKKVTSNYFILPGVKNGGGSLQNVSTLSSHRIKWIYKFDSPLCNGNDLEKYYFISKNYFKFSLYRNETHESVNITEFDLNFPVDFTFTIPPSFDVLNETILLRILFNGESFTKEDIVIPRSLLPPSTPTPPTVTIILGSSLALLLILLGIVVTFIILLIICWMKKQGEKKWQRLREKIRTCLDVILCLCVCKTMCPGLYEKMCPCLSEENYPCHCIRKEKPEEGKHPYN